MSATDVQQIEGLKAEQTQCQALLSDEELSELFEKYGVVDKRKRKLVVRIFFWLMVFTAGEPSRRGSLLQLIGFFIGALVILYPEKEIMSLSKTAVSNRLQGVSWYLFRGVYNHLLEKYKTILGAKERKFLDRFKDAVAVDGSVIGLSRKLEKVFASVHNGKSSLKLNTKYSLKIEAVTKIQVTSGKRHDSRFAFVTKEAGLLYLIDLGYWSFKLMKKIIDVGSFFVMRLKSSCDPLITAVTQADYQHLLGKRLSEISDFLQSHTDCGQIDLTVQLSTAKKPRFQEDVRLVGLFHEGEWRFSIPSPLRVDEGKVAQSE